MFGYKIKSFSNLFLHKMNIEVNKTNSVNTSLFKQKKLSLL
jgi:hypothetical protein